MGLQLVLDEHKIGGLNLHSTEADEIDPEVAHGAELLAAHAALALGFVRRNEDMHTARHPRTKLRDVAATIVDAANNKANQASEKNGSSNRQD